MPPPSGRDGSAVTAMPTEPILRLKGVAKHFGNVRVLDDIDLDIADGEFLTIVGPSGSGKTTLIRLLVGMDSPSTGELWLRDNRIDHIPANKRPTCMVFQSLALFPHRSVGQNIEFPLKVRGVPAAQRRSRALELMSLLRLRDDYYSRSINQCSGGERQRIALARALAFDPEILFFDEPLSALDYRLRKTLEKELKDLHRRTGKTFVYITHSLEEAMVMSDRIAIMRAGQFEQIGSADEIYARPVSRFVAEFMGEVNLFDGHGGEDGGFSGAGVEATVPAEPGAASKPLKPGEKTTLMVRPEFVHFLRPPQSRDYQVRGTLRAEYMLGSRTQYKVEAANGQILTVEKLSEDRIAGAPGDAVVLGWDRQHAHFLNGERA
ncbi:MAG: ABC transporter ATP-binding protein [Rhizobiaceae bacterium]|nr:ABC transporter ATP-binding protein [Rhizobiaceae bacterium]